VINNRDIVILKAFGKRLRTMRLQKGLSQHELALNAGVSKNQIGNIERGEVNVTLSTIYLIAMTLKVPIEELTKLEL
jgi:transcriptional regulator with XRE-family HTH domain